MGQLEIVAKVNEISFEDNENVLKCIMVMKPQL